MNLIPCPLSGASPGRPAEAPGEVPCRDRAGGGRHEVPRAGRADILTVSYPGCSKTLTGLSTLKSEICMVVQLNLVLVAYCPLSKVKSI